MEKPEDCSICLEKLGQEKSQECGHFFHFSCLEKHFKPECPLCRRKLNIKIKGNLNFLNQNSHSDQESELISSQSRDEILSEDEDIDDPRNFRLAGFNYIEEHPEYDSENPDGDEVEYY